jgi:hypothetical protein
MRFALDLSLKTRLAVRIVTRANARSENPLALDIGPRKGAFGFRGTSEDRPDNYTNTRKALRNQAKWKSTL